MGRHRHVQAVFSVFGDIDNDGNQDVFDGLDYPTPGKLVVTSHRQRDSRWVWQGYSQLRRFQWFWYRFCRYWWWWDSWYFLGNDFSPGRVGLQSNLVRSNAASDQSYGERLDLALTRDTKYEPSYTEFDQLAWFGLMHQKNDGRFRSVGAVSGINDLTLTTGRAIRMEGGQNLGWSDIDQEGDLNLLVGGGDQSGGRANFLFKNIIGQKRSSLAIRLIGNGRSVNRDAIGARVILRSSDWVMMREGKSSRGTYSSADTRVLHFGLGDFDGDFTLDVRWPDGIAYIYPRSMLTLKHFLVMDYSTGLGPINSAAAPYQTRFVIKWTELFLFGTFFLSSRPS